MTKLELIICEAENAGEIDLDTRDMMLAILNEATRQAKESRKFENKYIDPLYRKKFRLEANERKAYLDMENLKRRGSHEAMVDAEKKWKEAKKELMDCEDELRIAEQKRDKIDECGDLSKARRYGKIQAKINAGNDNLKKIWDKTASDSVVHRNPKEFGQFNAEHSGRQKLAKRYERPSGIYKKANTVNESSIDDIEIYDESTAASRRYRELHSEERAARKKYHDFVTKKIELTDVYKNEGNEKMIAAVEKKANQLYNEMGKLSDKRCDIIVAVNKANAGEAPSYRKGKYLPGNLDSETKARLNELRNNKRKKELGGLLSRMKSKYEQALNLKKEVAGVKLIMPSKRKDINNRLDAVINEYKKIEREYNQMTNVKQESVLEEIYEAELCGDITQEERALLIDYLND